MKNMGLRKLIFMGLLIALSAVGANLSIFSTIAFDSLPAFFGALLLGPVAGGVIGLIGHMISAFYKGFPMSLPVHIIIAVMMFGACFVFGYLYKALAKVFNYTFNLVIAVIAGTLINGPLMLAAAAYFLQIASGAPFQATFAMLIIPLSLASFINITLAGVIYAFIEKPIGRYF